MSTGYPAELAALTEARPGAYQTVHYGPDPEQFGELWPATRGSGLGRSRPARPAHRDEPGRSPVVILVHGGYWRDRYRLDLMHAAAADLSARGYAVWNIEYRRVGGPGGGWPGTFLDVAAAFDALADLAGEHRLDLGRVTAVGHSAGGHLALWACGRHRASAPGAAFGPPRITPALVVSLAGVCDLGTAAQLRLSDGAVLELLGGGPDEIPEIYAAACPSRLLPLGVPQVVVHGSTDVDVPLEVSRRYARAAGQECELLILPGMDHTALIDPAGPAWPELLGVFAR